MSAVRGKVTDGHGPVLLLVVGLLGGGVLVLTGIGLGIGGAGAGVGAQWSAGCGTGPPGVASGSGPLAASASL